MLAWLSLSLLTSTMLVRPDVIPVQYCTVQYMTVHNNLRIKMFMMTRTGFRAALPFDDRGSGILSRDVAINDGKRNPKTSRNVMLHVLPAS